MRELRFLAPYTQLHGILSPYKDGGGGGVYCSEPVGGLPFYMDSGETPSYGGSLN